MPDHDEVCLRHLARLTARSQIRHSTLTRLDPPPPQVIIDNEVLTLGRRKLELRERVARDRALGDLPPRDELFAEVILTEEEDCSENDAEIGVAAALILEAWDAE